MPLRAQYSGPVFRYRGDHEDIVSSSGRSRTHRIGEPRSRCRGAHPGLPGSGSPWSWQCSTGSWRPRHIQRHDRTVGTFGTSQVFVLNNVGRLRDGAAGLKAVEAQATKFRLISDDGWQDSALEQIVGMKDTQARHLIAGMIEQEDPEALGQEPQWKSPSVC